MALHLRAFLSEAPPSSILCCQNLTCCFEAPKARLRPSPGHHSSLRSDPALCPEDAFVTQTAFPRGEGQACCSEIRGEILSELQGLRAKSLRGQEGGCRGAKAPLSPELLGGPTTQQLFHSELTLNCRPQPGLPRKPSLGWEQATFFSGRLDSRYSQLCGPRRPGAQQPSAPTVSHQQPETTGEPLATVPSH